MCVDAFDGEAVRILADEHTLAASCVEYPRRARKGVQPGADGGELGEIGRVVVPRRVRLAVVVAARGVLATADYRRAGAHDVGDSSSPWGKSGCIRRAARPLKKPEGRSGFFESWEARDSARARRVRLRLTTAGAARTRDSRWAIWIRLLRIGLIGVAGNSGSGRRQHPGTRQRWHRLAWLHPRRHRRLTWELLLLLCCCGTDPGGMIPFPLGSPSSSMTTLGMTTWG